MNVIKTKQTFDQDDADLTTMALNAFESANGIQWRFTSNDYATSDSDMKITFEVGKSLYDYQVACKKNVDRKASLTHIKHQLSQNSKQGLLITTYISVELAEFCKEIEMQFIDLAGNAYLQAPGLYVFVKGQKVDSNQFGTTTKRGIGTVAAMKMLFALLCNQRLVSAPYRDIAKESGIYLGAVGTVIADLTSRGFLIETNKKEKRRLIDRSRLIDEWVNNYPFLLRPKLKSRRFKANNPVWWNSADLNSVGAVWSGEVAAQKITNYLKPITQTIYIPPEKMVEGLRELVKQYQFQADPNGPIEIVEKFWQFQHADHENLAPTLLVYADLMATLDARNIEVAMKIKEELIEHEYT